MKAGVHIEIDDQSGFCFGVVNAISKAEEALASELEVCSLGDIVHNRLEVQRLEALGLRTVTHSNLGRSKGKTVLIRAHGEPPTTYALGETLDMDFIDATCPVVARLQKIVADAWREMKAIGGQVVILGKHGHAEVVGLSGHAENRAIVVESIEELEAIDFTRPIVFLSQTTQSLELFEELSGEILRRAANPEDVVVKDTICRQVSGREAHLGQFAARFDLVLFIAGRKSSNGRVLFEVCRAANPNSYHIEESSDIDPSWLEGVGSIGICGATSTPQWLMEQVAEHAGRMTDGEGGYE